MDISSNENTATYVLNFSSNKKMMTHIGGDYSYGRFLVILLNHGSNNNFIIFMQS